MKYRLLNIARQLALMLLVIWTVVSLVTLLIEIVPGDPVADYLFDFPGAHHAPVVVRERRVVRQVA